MSEHLDERLRTAARTYRRLGNQSAESMFLESADTICKIQAENEKLRELVRHLYVCNQRLWIDNGVCVCALCPYLEYDCEFEQRILNLGIEVQP